MFHNFVKSCRSDPCTLESLWVSVIEGAHTATVSLPLTSIIDLEDSILFTNREPVEASLAPQLKTVSERIALEIAVRTASSKGDWRPIVLMLLAGPPPDEDRAINELSQLARQPSKPILLMATTSDLSFGESFCQRLLDAPLKVDQFTGEMIHQTWSYYGPFGPFWE